MVVIGDDEVDAQLACQLRFTDGGDAAVDRDDHFRPVGRELADGRRVEPVALLVAIRDVRGYDDAELTESADEDGGAGDAVDVIVPIDDDALASRERTTEPHHGAIKVAHRRAALGDPRRQKVAHIAGGVPARRQDPCDERRDAIRGIDGAEIGQEPAALRNEGHHIQVSHARSEIRWLS